MKFPSLYNSIPVVSIAVLFWRLFFKEILQFPFRKKLNRQAFAEFDTHNSLPDLRSI
jgi:hypothetical protein